MRNQFYCPKLKDNIMTGDFMKGIIGYQRYWLPQTADIRIRNCVTPPSRNELAEMVAEQMRRTERQGNEPFDSSFLRTATMI